MRIEVKDRSGVSVLRLNGALMLGDGDAELRRKIAEVIEKGPKSILLNLGGVTRMDSSGMGELIGAFQQARAAGVRIGIVVVPETVREVLGVARLSSVFDIFDDEERGVSSYRA